MYFIAYDIASTKSRNAVAKILLNYGTRVQRSAFECHIDKKKMQYVAKKILQYMQYDHDKLFILTVCKSCQKNVLRMGISVKPIKDDFYII